MAYDEGLNDVPRAHGVRRSAPAAALTQAPAFRRWFARLRAAELASLLRGSGDPCDQQLLAALDRWAAGDFT